jgi:hypothetical protein
VRDLSFAVPLEDGEQNDLERVLAVFERAAQKRDAEVGGNAKPRASASAGSATPASAPRKRAPAAKQAVATPAKTTSAARPKKTATTAKAMGTKSTTNTTRTARPPKATTTTKTRKTT